MVQEQTGGIGMILSVSRRTDIPNYYSDWFYNRMKDQFVYVRNPMNTHQVSKIDLSPEVVDCIVFWTKNPEPMIARLNELSAYHYYFQFTLTGYGKDMEHNVPHKKDKMIPIFQKLSDKIGSQKVIWRYDPILFTQTYTPEYHLKAFEQIAYALNGYTKKCVISFVDVYAKNKKTMKALGAYELNDSDLIQFSRQIYEMAKENNIIVASCAEQIDLSACGIEHNCCIDKDLIEKITKGHFNIAKDRNQRAECGCVESVDIGAYNTCKNECCYCYANDNQEYVRNNCRNYNANSPILCGTIMPNDKVTERKVR